MQRVTNDTLYFEIGSDNEPNLHVTTGEVFEVETQINRGPWIDNHPDRQILEQKLRGGNPASGCIYIEDAMPGQILIVNIGEIKLDPVGFTRYWGSTGAMPGWMGPSGIGEQQKVVQIMDGEVIWSDTLKLPVEPMLGLVGVAMEHTKWSNIWAGPWGGNMDIQEVTSGASVHIPVFVPGALLHIGDMHAIQGDGEICGAGGIEAGGRVKIWCDLAPKPKNMTWPRITNETHIVTTAQAKPAEDAFRLALVEMILWLEEEYGMTRGEAYLFLGQVLEARCTQFVNPTYTYICKVNRRYLQ
ncbi:acetamidase/formamidase family protein [Chloroflexota bacterium]